jgi:hypothetical protein
MGERGERRLDGGLLGHHLGALSVMVQPAGPKSCR